MFVGGQYGRRVPSLSISPRSFGQMIEGGWSRVFYSFGRKLILGTLAEGFYRRFTLRFSALSGILTMTLAVSPILVLLILLYGAASDQVVGVDITTVEKYAIFSSMLRVALTASQSGRYLGYFGGAVRKRGLVQHCWRICQLFVYWSGLPCQQSHRSLTYCLIGTGWAANLGFTAPGHILVDDGVSNPVEYDQDVAGTSCSVAAQHQNMAYGQYTVKITISSGEGGLTSFQCVFIGPLRPDIDGLSIDHGTTDIGHTTIRNLLRSLPRPWLQLLVPAWLPLARNQLNPCNRSDP